MNTMNTTNTMKNMSNTNTVKELGTILPNARSLALSEKMHALEEKQKEKIAAVNLSKYTRVIEQGETRYYDGANRYAIIGRTMKVLWFEKRADGWYSTR